MRRLSKGYTDSPCGKIQPDRLYPRSAFRGNSIFIFGFCKNSVAWDGGAGGGA